jgi:hypothetical protein
MMFLHATILFEIMLYSLLTLLQQPVSPNGSSAHSLDYNDACVDSSRKAIEAIVQVGKVSQPARSSGWGMFLNLYDPDVTCSLNEEPMLTLLGSYRWYRSSLLLC